MTEHRRGRRAEQDHIEAATTEIFRELGTEPIPLLADLRRSQMTDIGIIREYGTMLAYWPAGERYNGQEGARRDRSPDQA